PRLLAGEISGRVVHVDRFGNLVTDIPSGWLPAGPLSAQVGAHNTARGAGHHAEIPPGETALPVGSPGPLELAAPGGDLSRRWRVGSGTRVRVRWQPRLQPEGQ